KTLLRRTARAVDAPKTTVCLCTLRRIRRAGWRSGVASWCLPMRGNFVLLRLRRADQLRLEGFRRGTDSAALQYKDIAAPANLVVGEAGKPDPERNQVA